MFRYLPPPPTLPAVHLSPPAHRTCFARVLMMLDMQVAAAGCDGPRELVMTARAWRVNGTGLQLPGLQKHFS